MKILTMKNIVLRSSMALPILFPSMVLSENKPNIIFIITDQQRADAIGCSGNDRIITPHIDMLANEGFLFSNAYSSTPSSTPARAGLLTGMSPWHHGMLGYGVVAEHYRYELPKMLSDCGYLTLGIGKMHWTPQNALHGFHATILDESGRIESPYFMSDYRKWFQTMAPGKNPDVTGIGWNDHAAGEYKLPEELHPTAWTGNVAVRTIQHYDGSKPLFLKISFARPHSPYDPPKRVLDKYNNIEMEAPAKGEWSKNIGKNLTDININNEAAFAQFGDDYAKNSKRHYYAAITFIDEQIGRIISALKEKDMYDNTIICFTSDHGDMMGDHNHWRKTYAYEGSAAIPFIVKFPKSVHSIKPIGSVIENPVELRDFLPTFVDLAGGTVPKDIDGMSLVHLITENNPQWRKWIDLEHAACYSKDNYWVALTDGKLKYIWFLSTGKEQLFDLVKDPKESKNVVNDEKYETKLNELRKYMVQHLSERGDEWVKNGEFVIRKNSMLYSPNYPKTNKSEKGTIAKVSKFCRME